ncbi:prepilin peptidase [Telmatocola sphagniphila]|uniref:Prepilin peptidase n=1 Tax=Telmatocola sphagniphila TaxID=1123043 RepID=A0A8E6ESG2_9BACT|nr:A24 family peptidase [Telmatocola sphagniphila]QVL30679.1 prepilin peptidase [Telmatocola sphagniphila]
MGFPLFVFEPYFLICAFVLGTIIGSLLNVCIYRLPLEKSILWPGSRCMNCLTPLRGWSNIPVLSYIISRGKCRHCGVPYSSRYMWIELMTGTLFALLFYVEFHWNVEGIPFIKTHKYRLEHGDIPWQMLVLFVRDALFLSYLIVATWCDIDHKLIPLTVTLPGTVFGLIFTTLLPWPWPNNPMVAAGLPNNQGWFMPELHGLIPAGLTAWPVWGPLPEFLPPGSIQLGLANALAGALAGMFFVRAVRFLFMIVLGREPLGLGDADLMMMVGAFLGWQMTIISFFVGCLAALFINLPLEIFKKKDQEEGFPFGPGLVLGTLITWFSWRWLGRELQDILFSPFILGALAVFMSGGILVITPLVTFVLNRGPEEPAGK